MALLGVLAGSMACQQLRIAQSFCLDILHLDGGPESLYR